MIAQNEEWKEIEDFPRYLISNKGRIKSIVRKGKPIILKQATTDRGYKTVRLYSKNYPKGINKRVHRLAAAAFLQDFSADKEIHHRNGNRSENNIENLQCLTRFQHMEQHRKEAAEREAANAETD